MVLQELHSLYFCQTENTANFDLAEPIPGPGTDYYGELARRHGIVLVTSLFERRSAGLYHNTAVVFEKDRHHCRASTARCTSPTTPPITRSSTSPPATSASIPSTQAWAVLAYRFVGTNGIPKAHASWRCKGAELLIYPTAIGYESSDTPEEQERQREAWTTVQRGHAVANGLPVIAVNRVGHEPDPSAQTNGITFWGSSFVAGPAGRVPLPRLKGRRRTWWWKWT